MESSQPLEPSSPAGARERHALCTISLAALGWKPWGNVDVVIYEDGALGVFGWSNKAMLRLLRPPVPVLEPRDRAQRIAAGRRGELERTDADSHPGPDDCVFAAQQIGGASLRKGLVYARLRVKLADGHQVKILWMRRSRLHPPINDVEDALRRSMGAKLEVV